MCGIVGKLCFQGAPEQVLVKTMCSIIAHRGPDDEGTMSDGPVCMGNRRLAIQDLSPAGHQPMVSEDSRFHIVFNGEVYNFREVRSELQGRGHKFTSDGDTEVVLKAYVEWGEACLHRFNGMFALAIWDAKDRVLFLARDRMGIKPLYYFADGDKLVFGSEIKAILADSSVPRDINSLGLANFFTFGHSIDQATIFENIHKLAPGHQLRCRMLDNGRLDLQIDRYWELPFPNATEDKGEAFYADGVRQRLKESVRKRLIADVPVGVFLSGGLDSSAITGLAKEMLDQPPQTFSVGFDSSLGGFNELDDAREVARYFGTEHHEFILTEDDLESAMMGLVYQYDEPFGDAAAFPTYLLAKYSREFVPVALSGEGSDEVFGGYRRYIAHRWASKYTFLPQSLRRKMHSVVTAAWPSSEKLRRTLSGLEQSNPLDQYMSWLTVFSSEMKHELFAQQHNGFAKDTGRETYSRLYDESSRSSLEKLLYIDQQTWLPDTYLEKVDKATMATGLEARVPFLDHELVEFAATIPSKYKIKGTTTKWILKKAMSDLLPDTTIRKPKHGFAVPLAPWFRGRLRERVKDILFDPKARGRGYFDYDYVEKMYRSHVEGKANYYKQLWLLVVFELWCQQYLDKTSKPAEVISVG